MAGSDEPVQPASQQGQPDAAATALPAAALQPQQIVRMIAAVTTPFSNGVSGAEQAEQAATNPAIGQHQQVLHPGKSMRPLAAQNSLAAIDSALLFQGSGSVKPNQQQVEDALELLHTLLNKVARLDAERCFENPVTEAEAPDYFRVSAPWAHTQAASEGAGNEVMLHGCPTPLTDCAAPTCFGLQRTCTEGRHVLLFCSCKSVHGF
jgi:hypothetical protein